MIDRVQRLREAQKLKSSLHRLMNNPDFKTFWEHYLRSSNVSRPTFATDPYRIVWNESRRHLAMSYLNILAKEDPQQLIDALEKEAGLS